MVEKSYSDGKLEYGKLSLVGAPTPAAPFTVALACVPSLHVDGLPHDPDLSVFISEAASKIPVLKPDVTFCFVAAVPACNCRWIWRVVSVRPGLRQRDKHWKKAS